MRIFMEKGLECGAAISTTMGHFHQIRLLCSVSRMTDYINKTLAAFSCSNERTPDGYASGLGEGVPRDGRRRFQNTMIPCCGRMLCERRQCFVDADEMMDSSFDG